MIKLIEKHPHLWLDVEYIKKLAGKKTEYPKHILDEHDAFSQYMFQESAVKSNIWPKWFTEYEKSTFWYFIFSLGIKYQNACNQVANTIYKLFR